VSPGSYIKHIIVIVQENRSFENIFAGWPGADAPMYRYLHTGNRVELHALKYADDCVRVQGYLYCDMITFGSKQFAGGTMARWTASTSTATARMEPEIAPYRSMASQ
jgi:hypothetical protein